MERKRIFSGVQPTGALHLGSYLGAIRQWVLHQAENDNIFCVVDLHSLTIPEAVDANVLRAKSREVAGLYLACGIDPERCAVSQNDSVAVRCTQANKSGESTRNTSPDVGSTADMRPCIRRIRAPAAWAIAVGP